MLSGSDPKSEDEHRNNLQQRLQRQQQQQQQQQPPVQQQKQVPKKKKKADTPHIRLLVAVQKAAKANDPAAGIAAYKEAQASGTAIKPDLYSTLLYLCAGGDEWESPLRQQLIETTPVAQDIMQREAAAIAAEIELAAAVEDDTAEPSSSNGATATAVATDISTVGPPSAASTVSSAPNANDNGNSPAKTKLAPTSEAHSSSDTAQLNTDETVAPTVMSPAELNEAGRAIFEQMQVHLCYSHA